MRRFLVALALVLVATVAYGQSGQTGWNIFGALPTLRFHDTSAADRDTTSAIASSCAVTTSGAEDCAVALQSMANGTLQNLFIAAGDGVTTIGGADTTLVAFTTDGTGDGEVTLPADSIGPAEMSGTSATVQFCGQGIAAAADMFMRPPVAPGEELLTGNTACDANDETAVATADDILWTDFHIAYDVVGMDCRIGGVAGVDDTDIVLTLYDDTVATAITCTLPTLDTNPQVCADDEASVVTVAANSLVAVAMTSATGDDDLSTSDFMCWVHIVY